MWLCSVLQVLLIWSFTWGIFVPAPLWGAAKDCETDVTKRIIFFFSPHLKTHLESDWSTETTVHSAQTLYNSRLTVTAFWLVPGICISPPRWKTTQGYTPTNTHHDLHRDYAADWMKMNEFGTMLNFFFFPILFYLFLICSFSQKHHRRMNKREAPGATD